MVQKIEQIGIGELIRKITTKFDRIAEIYVAHPPSTSNVSKLILTVHTGDAELFEQYVEIDSADKVMIDVSGADPLSLPYDVMATVDGPGHIQGTNGTTVYMAETVMGSEPRELFDGLRILRQKLAGVCPSCEAEVGTLGEHYRNNLECQQAERV